MHSVPGRNNGVSRQHVAMTVPGDLPWKVPADIRYCSSLIRAVWALTHLLMLQAITLHATAKHTFARRRTRSLPIPWALFSSEFVASIPERCQHRSSLSPFCRNKMSLFHRNKMSSFCRYKVSFSPSSSGLGSWVLVARPRIPAFLFSLSR